MNKNVAFCIHALTHHYSKINCFMFITVICSIAALMSSIHTTHLVYENDFSSVKSSPASRGNATSYKIAGDFEITDGAHDWTLDIEKLYICTGIIHILRHYLFCFYVFLY